MELNSKLVVFSKDEVIPLCESTMENSREKPLVTEELKEQVLCENYFSGLPKNTFTVFHR